MRFFFAFLACCIGLGGCSEERPRLEKQAKPLIGGTPTAGDPGVAALSASVSNSFCTATLISPRVLLTAAHCIDDSENAPDLAAHFGEDYTQTASGTRISIVESVQHEDWTGSLGQFDIGLMLLEEPFDPGAAVPLNTTPANTLIGQAYRHVGFGVSDREAANADGLKRTGTNTIDDTASDLIESGDMNLSVCFGDSGGPAFVTIQGVEYVAGVHSSTTSTMCLPPNRDTRVDLYVESFILPYIQANDTTCQEDFLCAPIGCVDDPDCLPCGPDGTCATDCELPDADCPTSGPGEICRADSQCMSGSCVPWLEDPNFKFCADSCTIGEDECPSGMTCRNRPNVGPVCYFDDTPQGVIGDTCSAHTDCGTYQCSGGICTKDCDAALDCPNFAECTPLAEKSICTVDGNIGSGDSDSGCGCGADPVSPFSALLVLLFVRRRRS